MLKINKLILPISTCFVFLLNTGAGAFIAPSLNLEKQSTFNESFQRTQELGKVSDLTAERMNDFHKIAAKEQEGFLGYYGDSIDFLIYQDIIRFVIEEIVEIPVRADFQFLAPPLDPMLKIQTKEDLVRAFDNAMTLQEGTFPLNFTLWDNLDRLGLNTIRQFVKNEPVKPLGYERRLKWLFERLGIQNKEIAPLFQLARQRLASPTGVILQFFDTTGDSYAVAKNIAYPAYPNGFIAANKTVDEYFMDDDFTPPYPHEIRLILNNSETLNPSSKLKIVRYTPDITPSQLSSYQKALRKQVKKLSSNKTKRKSYQKELQSKWKLK